MYPLGCHIEKQILSLCREYIDCNQVLCLRAAPQQNLLSVGKSLPNGGNTSFVLRFHLAVVEVVSITTYNCNKRQILLSTRYCHENISVKIKMK